jgi:hypothetical protein
VTAEVRIPGVSEPDGVVTISYGGRSIKAKVHDYDDGTVIVTLPKLNPGTYSIRASYAKSRYSRPSTSATATLTVS